MLSEPYFALSEGEWALYCVRRHLEYALGVRVARLVLGFVRRCAPQVDPWLHLLLYE